MADDHDLITVHLQREATRITEAMTRYACHGRRGIGMSECLDQIVGGRPVGPDLR